MVRSLGLAIVVLAALSRGAAADDDPVWRAYDAAFDALSRGDKDVAVEALTQLRATSPDHPAAARAAAVLAAIPPDADIAGVAPPPPEGPHAISRIARGELIFGMTVSGVLAARDVCAPGCSDREWAAALMIGGGGALGATVALTRKGVHDGQAQLLNSATTWASWNALAINDGFAEDEEEAAYSIAMQAGGLAAGFGLWESWRPTAGDVALANSGLFWSTVIVAFGHIAADEEPALSTLVIAGDIGLVAAALVSSEVKMSRGRTMLIDTGGVLGTLFGGLIAISSDDGEVAGGSLAVGATVGLLLGAVVTDKFDAPDPPVQVSPTPLANGGLGMSVGGAF